MCSGGKELIVRRGKRRVIISSHRRVGSFIGDLVVRYNKTYTLLLHTIKITSHEKIRLTTRFRVHKITQRIGIQREDFLPPFIFDHLKGLAKSRAASGSRLQERIY